jgi:hypothetical protein
LIPERLAQADPRLIALLRVWQAARQGDLVPRRGRFDPFSVPKLMPNLWLYRYDAERGDFVCRLAGEDVNRAWGRPIRGLTLREIVGEADHAAILERWHGILETPLIHYGTDRERLTALSLHRAERLLLPLADDASPHAVNQVLGASVYRLDPPEDTRPALYPEDIVRIPCSEI